MDYEKKYKEALERAKEFYILCKKCGAKDTVDFLENTFSELKESEDEKIRNLCEELVRTCFMNELCTKEDKDECIAWLEKQGEQNPYSGTSFEYNGHTWGMCARDNGVEILFDGELKAFLSSENSFIYPIHPQPDLTPKNAMEAIKEEKVDNANKVEPKFKVDDFIKHNKANIICKVIAVNSNDNSYYVENIGIDGSRIELSNAEQNFHLWSIKDAKDGDVLVTVDNKLPFIYKGCLDPNHPDSPVAYCGIDCEGYFCIGGDIFDNNWWTEEEVQPATREQSDLLFSKMKEAGYEWSAEKKELKAEPKFKVGDWIVDKSGLAQQVLDFRGGIYTCTYNSFTTDCESNYHLWTIQDAKDGDVLFGSGRERNVILMFRGIGNAEWDDVIDYHCYYDYHRKEFIVQKDLEYWGNTENNQLKPATKEQREQLFQKIKEAGYEWDAENKELKIIDWSKHVKCEPIDPSIIEEKSVWTEEDEKMLEDIRFNYESNKSGMTEGLIEQYNKWFEKIKSLKPQPKQEWSEEDERNLKCMMKIIKEKAFADYDVDEDNNMLGIYGILESWLKSLKGRVQPQWKPSSEYIAALEYQVNSTCKGSWQYEASKELLEQLKKL